MRGSKMRKMISPLSPGDTIFINTYMWCHFWTNQLLAFSRGFQCSFQYLSRVIYLLPAFQIDFVDVTDIGLTQFLEEQVNREEKNSIWCRAIQVLHSTINPDCSIWPHPFMIFHLFIIIYCHSKNMFQVKDIYGGAYQVLGLPGDLTASSFGKTQRDSKGDSKEKLCI